MSSGEKIMEILEAFDPDPGPTAGRRAPRSGLPRQARGARLHRLGVRMMRLSCPLGALGALHRISITPRRGRWPGRQGPDSAASCATASDAHWGRSRTTSAGLLSSRSPRKRGCRSRASLVHSANPI